MNVCAAFCFKYKNDKLKGSTAQQFQKGEELKSSVQKGN
jgi:hypothetical protein